MNPKQVVDVPYSSPFQKYFLKGTCRVLAKTSALNPAHHPLQNSTIWGSDEVGTMGGKVLGPQHKYEYLVVHLDTCTQEVPHWWKTALCYTYMSIFWKHINPTNIYNFKNLIFALQIIFKGSLPAKVTIHQNLLHIPPALFPVLWYYSHSCLKLDKESSCHRIIQNCNDFHDI